MSAMVDQLPVGPFGFVAAFEGLARKRGECRERTTLSHFLQRGYPASPVERYTP